MRATFAGFVAVLVGGLAILGPAVATADRTCRIRVFGQAKNAGRYTVATERGFAQPVAIRSADIPSGTDRDVAAELIANTIAPPTGANMVGVVSVARVANRITVTLVNDASMIGFESVDARGMGFSGPGCAQSYAGGKSKVRVGVSVGHIIVPDSDRTPRAFKWTVQNLGNDSLPGDFEVEWTEDGNITFDAGKNTGGRAAGLGPHRKITTQARVHLTSNIPGVREKGIAFARPNTDPALDDPDLAPVLLDEGAGSCIQGAQPSATLLIPYFEVDFDNPGGRTTLTSINNSAGDCTLSRVTLWTDWGVPTLTFYVYLSPNDVQTLNVRDLFNNVLPDTSAVLESPECSLERATICRPEELETELTNLQLSSLRADHTGQPNPESGDCASSDRGDHVARGYMTVDTADACAFQPTIATYAQPEWTAPEGFFSASATSMDNHLWGDFFYIDPLQNSAQGEAAVHIPADPARFADGGNTFYGRYVGFDGSDGRLPLSSRYRYRFLNGGPFDGGTQAVIWRDNLSPSVERQVCGNAPSWFPLGERKVTIYDESENSVELPGLAAVCPLAHGSLAFSCPFNILDLQPAGFVTPFIPPPFGYLDVDFGRADGAPAQAWVMPVMSAEGRFSVGFDATRANDLCLEDPPPPPEELPPQD